MGTAAALGTIVGGTVQALDWLTKNGRERRDGTVLSKQTYRNIQDIFFDGLGPTFAFHPGSVKYHPSAGADDDWAAIKAICNLFASSGVEMKLAYRDLLEIDGGLICLGSPATNILSELCMRCSDDRYVLGADGKAYALGYRHRTDLVDRTVSRMLSNAMLREPNYEIIDLERNGPPHRSRLKSDGTPADAYLLFSKLPHPRRAGEAVCIWAGNIGPGTEAVHLLLGSDDALASSVADRLRDFSGENPFFQALFKVDEIELSRACGRHIPKSCRLIGQYPVRPAD